MSANKMIRRIFPVLLNAVIILVLLIASTAFPISVRADSTITVATSADESNTNGLCSLREAIANANADALTWTDCVPGSGNDTILFADGISLITLVSTLPIITDTDGLTINGGGDVSVSGNNSVRVFYASGGAVFTLQNITVANGSSDFGAGVFFNGGMLDVTNSTFSGNSVTSSGGGVYSVSGTATIANSTFSGNSAVSDGGGVLVANGTLTISNSTFSNNSGNYGGGLINNSGNATIVNSTFSGNSAPYGSGVATYKGGTPVPTTTIRNTILANSAAGEDCWNGPMSISSGGNNIIESTASCGGIASLTSDPLLGALTGSPAYFPLNPGSPAIDAGDDTVCAAAPVNNTSQNKVPRPQGTHCDIGSFELLVTVTFKSMGANDGWILESSETSSVGGTLNAIATTFNLGDDPADRQYRSILHFDTSSLPDTAVITRVTLKIRKQGQVGVNPFTVLGGLLVDMRKPSFGAAALAIGDFQAVAGRSTVATFGLTPVSNWYSAVLNGSGRAYVNKTGATQFRLLFATDDNNNNVADYMKFFSGNALAAARPQLIVEYYVP